MALFLSTFVNKVDRKGRVSVPASFRAALAGQSFLGIVAYRSFKLSCVEGSGIDRMQEMSGRVDAMGQFSESYDNASVVFSDAQQLPFDGEGRVMLPQVLALHPSPVTLEELVRELGDERDFGQRDAIERAVRDLVGSGLLHRCGALVLPSRAALRFEELSED